MVQIAANIQTVAPASLPVTTQTVKDTLRIAASVTADDSLIAERIAEATEWVEQRSHRALITQTREQSQDRIDWVLQGGVRVPGFYLRWSPAIAISSITYVDTNGDSQTVTAANYRLDIKTHPSRITEALDKDWPSDYTTQINNAWVITYTAGYGATAASVPYAYRTAVAAKAARMHDPSFKCDWDDDRFDEWLDNMMGVEGRSFEYA